MNNSAKYNEPLISVIIPCYNHAKYLATAVTSVYNQQGYSNYEIIVVDDGSSDDTKAVSESFPGVLYVYQDNAGLSAARNTGISNSKGKYLIFLDADDWLLPDAMAIGSKYLIGNDNIAFVSGGYEYFFESRRYSEYLAIEVTHDHYCKLLEMNYIGMHATVMYQHWVFNSFLFDTSLKACEDYDIYLKVAREFPVIHHPHLMAVYRVHDNNMSGNILLMLESAVTVLKRQEKDLRNAAERESYNKGLVDWRKYYERELYLRLLYQLTKSIIHNPVDLQLLKRLNRQLYKDFIKERNTWIVKNGAKKILPRFIIKWVRRIHPYRQ